jgi:exodeoxyribonuclease VII small subunit
MSSDKSYKQLSEELDKIIAWFESDDVDLEHAIANYEKAEKLIGQMEQYLKRAENKIKKIIKESDG